MEGHQFDNSLADLPAEVAADLERVTKLIQDRAGSETVQRIHTIAEHLFGGGGKRVRPMLTICSARMLNYSGIAHIELAAAVEFVHTATLAHDDVVDQSRQRRGRPTAQSLWNNKTSVLVGDFLFARSFQLMVASKSMRALAILADTSAVISEAEILQLVTQGRIDLPEATYFQIIRGKTAALFTAASQVGAVIAGGTEAQIDACESYGNTLGMGYQMMDDMLDYSGSEAKLGKRIGDDFRDMKLTLPAIRGVATANEAEKKFWERVFVLGEQRDGDFERAMEILVRRGILEEIHEEAIDWSTRSKDSLAALPDNSYRAFLSGLADFAVRRSH